MSPISKGLASFAVAAVLSTAAAAQGLVTQKNIPLATAQTIANAALTKCESMGFTTKSDQAAEYIRADLLDDVTVGAAIEGIHATAPFLHPTRACARRRDGREPRQS
jgi:hypothetical protein